MANAAIDEIDKAVFEDGCGNYGALRLNAELVAHLMRLAGPQGVHRRKGRRRSGHLHELHQDHVAGAFTQDAPDREWVADVTQHRTDAGWLYLSVVIDAFHRHVVGWAMDDVLNTDLVLSALQMAQQARRPAPGLIHHSDQGSPYGSLRFGRHLRATGVVSSMGRSVTPADNAVAESFFAKLQTELLDRHHCPTRDALRMAVFEFIEVFYNRQRRHSHLGNLSPAGYQRRWYEQQAQAQVRSP